ncbi:MFS transporter [Streptomyces rapamycinicus]|uniref:MFS transporter n=2 Tax=Streptomyces rapamycinicus TaxID=1226757 RepID=A0A0A0NN38_STRRN|nr:MFS transporter [Streptomyces rapamycinicus]AGP58621.1 MFS transporter [Streptomyces rapamycinicus NRRL 5491]MBB4786333.1 MFS family permease [Streptomyces rapamycinicus]RLV78207.1 MFS transporter [Streptomyces rapamycinicus NRRL 5491]UTO66431.1 MFS transporter [Streptomyces rapamycinicus]UTP34385.1 MFS transporter [Streptomyces rapamycinicus NRRL 5491]
MTTVSSDPVAPTRRLPRIGVRPTRKATAIAFFAWVFAVYDYILFGTLLPEISDRFGWSEERAALVSTLISAGTAIVVLGVGPLVDRLGRRKGMILTVSGTALASAASAGTVNAGYLVGARSLGGIGLSEQSVNTTYLNEIYAVTEDEAIKKRRGFVYSLVQAGWPTGTLVAAAFVAVFLPLVGWRGCFLLATFPAVVIALLRRGLPETPQFELEQRLRRLRREGKPDEARRVAAEYGVDEGSSAPLLEIFRGRARRNTLVLSFAWLANWFGIQTFSVLGTTVLTKAKGVSFANSLVLFIVINAVAFAGYLFHGWAGDRFGRRNVIGCGWILSGVLFALMLTVAHGTVAVVVLYSLGMFFLVGPYAAMLFYMGECYDTRCRATGTSFINAFSQPGAIAAGAIATAMLASGAHWDRTALLVGAVGTFLSGFVMFAARRVDTVEA